MTGVSPDPATGVSPDAARSRTWLLPTLHGYRRDWLGWDLLAGLATGAVIIPQAMAYATIAGMPVQTGLYTCIVPLILYAAFGGSRTASSTTTSTIATLTASALAGVGIAVSASSDSKDVLRNLATLVLLTGAFLLLARLFRLGSLVENISEATLVGVKIGVGVTVAVGQLPQLLGVEVSTAGLGFLRALGKVISQLGHANLTTIALSAVFIVLLFVLPKLLPRLPATLLVVVLGIVLVATTNIENHGVAKISPVPSGLPTLSVPDLHHVGALIPGALAIAVMAFLETVSVARNMRQTADPPIDSNQELLAAGLCCVGGAFTSTLPSAGGFSQSAVNAKSGAKTQLAGLGTAVLAVLIALFLAPVLDDLPQATLAAIVFVAVIGLIDVKGLIALWHINRVEFATAAVTALLGLTAGLLAAVGFGVIATLILVLREVNRPSLFPMVRVAPDVWVADRDAAGHGTPPPDGVLVVRAGRGLYAASVRANADAISALVATQRATGTSVHAVIFDLERQSVLTTSVLKGLQDLERELTATGVTLHFARIPTDPLGRARSLSWVDAWVVSGRTAATIDDAIRAAGQDAPSG